MMEDWQKTVETVFKNFKASLKLPDLISSTSEGNIVDSSILVLNYKKKMGNRPCNDF